MGKFKRRATTVEAWQWTDSPEAKPEWVTTAESCFPSLCGVRMDSDRPLWKGHVVTRQGLMNFGQNDWLVCSDGFIYPVGADSFSKTYKRTK